MKENPKIKNLSKLIGKGIQMKENKKLGNKKDEEFFMDILDELCQIKYISTVSNSLGINLIEYEGRFIRVTEMTLTYIYGEPKTSVIMWWVFESISPDGKLLPLIDENDKEHLIRTPTQLYKFLKRYDGK